MSNKDSSKDSNKDKIMGKSKVLINNAITIPKIVRLKFGLSTGDYVFWIEDEKAIKLKKGKIKIVFESDDESDE